MAKRMFSGKGLNSTLLNLLTLFAVLLFLLIPLLTNAQDKISTDKFQIEIKGNKLSIDAKEADIREILKAISEKTGIEYEIGEDVKDKIIAMVF